MAQVREAIDAASHPALLLVDGVSSIGALDFQFDAWKVDVAVTGSQKGLSLPTGLGIVMASQKVSPPLHLRAPGTTSCRLVQLRQRCSEPPPTSSQTPARRTQA